MTVSKDLVVDVHPDTFIAIQVFFGDDAILKVLGLNKVVISPGLTIEKVMLVCVSYVDYVALLWSKNLKVAFVGHVEDGLYVVNFLKRPTETANCLMAKVDMGWFWHRGLAHVNMRSL